MPPRISFLSTRAIAFRTRRVVPQKRAAPSLQQRFASDDATKAPGSEGPNMNNAPHVSEEQAAMDKTMGETPPDIEGQGTPVQEVRHTTRTYLGHTLTRPDPRARWRQGKGASSYKG